jgi:SAM-dependent methyltransferase
MDLWSLADLCTPWCIHVVATLRIAQHLDAGRVNIQELATASSCHPDSLQRVLRHLVAKGVFEEPAPGRFGLNDVARQFLVEPIHLGLDLDSFGSRMAGAWNTLLSAVRTGSCKYHEAFGRPFWEDLDAHPMIAADFDALIGPAGHGTPDPNVLPDASEWAAIRTVIDVGGGTGALLAEILRAHPHIHGTLVDQPRTIARSAAVFREAGVEDRVRTAGQSFFDALPLGADLYLLKNVLSDWPDAEACAILKRCAEAAKPSNGRVVFLTNSGPGAQADPELLMMVLVGGRGRTIEEFRSLTQQAGLEISKVSRIPSGRFAVECRPV